MKKNIILIGFKNCGKSTFGKLLSEQLQKAFIDTDQLIEESYYTKHNAQLSAREIYQAVGASTFRLLEKEAILALQDQENTVIATGGGSVLDQESTAFLKSIGVLIYLKVPKHLIKARAFTKADTNDNKLPAFLQVSDPESAFEKMYAEREVIYEQVADVVIEINLGDNYEAVINEIIEKIERKYGKQFFR